MKIKKTGIATGTIINPRLENVKKKKEERIKRSKNCNRCKSFYKKNSWCYRYNFRVSTIELGSKCKDYDSRVKKNKK